MNLRRIYAKPGYGKTALIIDEIVAMRQQQLVEGLLAIEPILVIAPQQYSYSFEAQLSERLSTLAEIDITYFNRLARQILQEAGQMPVKVLTSSSQFLLMHRAILEIKAHLSVFHTMAGSYRFTNEMINQIKAFKQYGITVEKLAEDLSHQPNERLSDLLLIYQQYETLCVSRENAFDNEAILQLALKYIKTNPMIAQSTVYITDFYNFSELEYRFIGELIQAAKQVVIAESYPVELLKLKDGQVYQPLDDIQLEHSQYQWSMWRKYLEMDAKLTTLVKTLNYQLITEQQQELVHEIWQVLDQQKIVKYMMRHQQGDYQVAVLSDEDNPYSRFDNEALQHISASFDQFNSVKKLGHQHVMISEHQTVADEVAAVGHDIIKKMQQDPLLSWDDFTIMYRDSDKYASVLTEMAHHYQIPIDISEKHYIKNHRLIRLLFKLLRIANGDWRSENILGVFKTGLMTYSRSIIHYLFEMITQAMTIDVNEKLTINEWQPLFYQAIEQLPKATRHNWIKTTKELDKQFEAYQADEALYDVEEFSYRIGYLLTRVYDELDELENEMIKYNVQTKAQWQQPYIFGQPQYFDKKAQQATTVEAQQSYQFLSNKAQKYEDIRQAIVKVFINEQASCIFDEVTTVGQYISVIYQFLIASKVEVRLSHVKGQKLTAQLKETMDRDHQVWQKLILLFEQLHDILGDVEINNDDFIDLLSTILEVITYDTIPSGQNYVMASHFDRILSKNKRHVYLLGLNSDSLPHQVATHSLLTDEDRLQLHQLGLKDHQSAYLLMVDEELLAYRLLTSARSSISASYTVSTLAGVQQGISPYLQRLQSMFTDCPIVTTPAIISLNQPYQSQVLTTAATPYELMRYINHYLQQIKDVSYQHQLVIADDQTATYNQQQLTLAQQLLTQQSHLLQGYQQLLIDYPVYGEAIYQSLNYRHLPKSLSKQVAQLLYQNNTEYSVSRLETYNQSPYLYFLRYGLRLKPREQIRLDSAKMGTLWHAVLSDNRIIAMINQHTERQVIPDQNAIEALVTTVLNDKIAQDSLMTHLLEGQKLQYQQFIDLLTKVVSVEAYQHPFSDYERQLIEEKYSVEYSFKVPFEAQNEAGQRLTALLGIDHIPSFTLRGVIDRIDINQKDQSLQIIDYKSSDKTLQWELLASGHQLQLVTYLWMTQFIPQLTDYQPAGMYYFYLNNKTVDTVEYPTLAEQVKLYQLKGLTVATTDQQVLNHDHSNDGSILNIKTNKDGSLNKNSWKAVISPNELTQLYQVVMGEIVKIINRIYQGDITLSAVQYKQKELTYFNEYQAICLFDEVKYPQQIIKIQNLNKEDVLGGENND